MKKSLVLTLMVFMLTFALPMGSAFAVNSPDVNSPDVNSPDVNSPDVNAPKVVSPQVTANNVASNTINSAVNSTVESGASAGTLASPHSGAINLMAVGAITVVLLVGAGAAAWALRKKLRQQ